MTCLNSFSNPVIVCDEEINMAKYVMKIIIFIFPELLGTHYDVINHVDLVNSEIGLASMDYHNATLYDVLVH